MSTNESSLAEFRIVRSKCGLPTAVHVPSGILLHSRVNPAAEAAEIAAQHASAESGSTVLLGGGLGYLAEALAVLKGPAHSIYVVEPDISLIALARRCRGDALYFSLPGIHYIRVSVPFLLTRRTKDIVDASDLIVAPYFERIAVFSKSPIAGFVQILRTERSSRTVYDSIVGEHSRANSQQLESLPGVLNVRLNPNKKVVVVGAGPSLNGCVDALRRNRRQVIIVAASGAVPSLQAAGIIPDWAIALEGRDAIVNDLCELPPSASLVVFSATHPRILAKADHALYRGSELESRGGTTAVPALDFALRCSSSDIFLVGLDLGYSNGAYASGALRDEIVQKEMPELPAKFVAMRTALENVINNRSDGCRCVSHVLTDAPVLKGTRRLPPEKLAEVLAMPVPVKETV